MPCILQDLSSCNGSRFLTTEPPGNSLGFTLHVVYSVGLVKGIMTCIHHYGIIEYTLKILWTQY